MKKHDYVPEDAGRCRGCGRAPGEVRTLEKAGRFTVDECPGRRVRRATQAIRNAGPLEDLLGVGGSETRDGVTVTWVITSAVEADQYGLARIEAEVALDGNEWTFEWTVRATEAARRLRDLAQGVVIGACMSSPGSTPRAEAPVFTLFEKEEDGKWRTIA